ncbi:hypothetical protein NIIDMKKI_77650 [Mycobacterium kansasii]|uniref:CobQ/CobB/MinD/ParA nucleotide binding domain-containing protein n=1 Tax=Mycobacterium kansasii TaxID=1768 RepID=A0A7G1IRG2_MYCKA|nr:hypothetical protein NIIDMKKI_77650 [Mycobacterium kansasii]
MVSFGLVNPGPSAAQREAADFEAAIRTALRGSHKVGVLGKGGVGKTSVAASIGSIFAELRQPDRVVAIDADTAFGRLSSRIDPAAHGSFWDLTAAKDLPSFADIVARLGRNSVGLHVLPGEPMAGARRVLDPAIYREAVLRLDRHFAISVIDCGSTMDAPLTQEVLRDLDALIVVSSPWADGASAAAKTMEWLSDRRLTDLLRRSVVVLNDSDGHSDKRTRSVLAREFVEHGQRVVEVPFDPHLRPGGVIDVRHELAPATRLKLLQIAAIIVEYFASGPAERRAPAPRRRRRRTDRRRAQPDSAARFRPSLSMSTYDRTREPAVRPANHANGPVMINSSVVRTPSPSSSMRCTASTERPGWVATQVNVRIGCSLVTVHTIGRPFGWVTRYRLPTANGPVSRRSISRMDFVQAGQPSTSTSNSHTRAAGACTISSRMYRIRHLPFDRHHRTDEPDDSGGPER